MQSLLLEFNNFRCYETGTIEIKSGVTLIDGISGRGKSSVCNAIYYVLYGKLKKPYTYGKKKCSVKMTLADGVWFMRQSGPSKLQVGIDNDVYEDDVAQAVIANLYGKEQEFLATSYMRQDEKHILLTGTNEEKMDLIRSISLTEDVKLIKTRLNDELKKVQDQVVKAKTELDKASSILTEFDNNNPILHNIIYNNSSNSSKATTATTITVNDIKSTSDEEQLKIHNDALAKLELIKPELHRILQLEANLKTLKSMNVEEVTADMVQKSQDVIISLEHEKNAISIKLNMHAEYKIKEAAIAAAKEQAERVRKEYEKAAAEKLARVEQEAKNRAAKLAEKQAARSNAIEKRRVEKREQAMAQYQKQVDAVKAQIEQSRLQKQQVENQRNQIKLIQEEKTTKLNELKRKCDELTKAYDIINLDNEIARLSKNKVHIDNIEGFLKQFTNQDGTVLTDINQLVKKIDELTREITEKNNLLTEVEISLVNKKSNEEQSRLLVCPKCSAGLRTEDHKLHLVRDNFKPEIKPIIIQDATDEMLDKIKAEVVRLNDLKERATIAQKQIGQEKLQMGRFVPADIEKLAKCKELQSLIQLRNAAQLELESYTASLIPSEQSSNQESNELDENELLKNFQMPAEPTLEEIMQEFPPLEDDDLTNQIDKISSTVLIENEGFTPPSQIDIVLPILPNESEAELKQRNAQIDIERRQQESIITKRQVFEKYQADLQKALEALGSKNSDGLKSEIVSLEQRAQKAKELADLVVKFHRRNELSKLVDNLKPEIEKLSNRAQGVSTLQQKAKQVESTVLYNTVVSLNLEMKRFLDVLFAEDQISVEFKTTKELKTQSKTQTKTSMVCSMNIFYKDNHLDDYKTLSGGEISRISLALMLALNSLKGSNIILLDESLSTINESLKMDVVDLLKTVVKDDKICALILHSSVQGVYDHVISL